VKKSDIQERRKYFVMIYVRTASLKAALEATYAKFGVSVPVLRVDWNRRDKWPEEILENANDPVLMDIYDLGIRRTLQQTELFIAETDNPNCKLGGLKLKFNILFKLKESVAEKIFKQEILERLANLEKKFENFELQNGKVR